MAKFRIALGFFLLMLAPALLYIGLDSQQNGIDLAEAHGSRSSVMFETFGVWGMFIVFVFVGISEIVAGKELLNKQDEE